MEQKVIKNALSKAENLLNGENSKVDKLIYLPEKEPQITYPHYEIRDKNYQAHSYLTFRAYCLRFIFFCGSVIGAQSFSPQAPTDISQR